MYKKLSPAQEIHLKEIMSVSTILIDNKYRKGAEEHGDNLREMIPTDLVEEMLGEVVDMLVYTIELAKKLNAFKNRYEQPDLPKPPEARLYGSGDTGPATLARQPGYT